MQIHDPEATSPVRHLLSAAAVRERAGRLLDLGLKGELEHFTVHLDRLGPTAEAVIETIRADYPTLDIPFHARWRHFAAGGLDRWGTLNEALPWADAAERGRASFDLAIVSVLLDAGAGPDWCYEEGRTGDTFARSEGLAVASFDMFIGGTFSGDPGAPLRADAGPLSLIDAAELARGFQVRLDNPLVGLPGRAELLNRLGHAVTAAPTVFALGDDPRPGGLFDHLVTQAAGEQIPAPAILEAILLYLGPVWPGRLDLDGIGLGDTWRHPALGEGEAGLVPFHKLSQWLTYSLIEPLEEAGISVVDLDGLTGLPEYRNGGLFIDTGVLQLREADGAGHPHEVGSTLVVEWRALTVALLDLLAQEIRQRLDLDARRFPLAKVLEGGTWATGRRLARAVRPGGAPPIAVVSDGTVF
ncbi:URC4/urg3 family protein [uncultured Enterovirga sp.]|uniref:URC4/urg3 family protein n=1 Tax=uncultured Enterovirga sp. TaxID=2026352 RepID=UPI0035CBA647